MSEYAGPARLVLDKTAIVVEVHLSGCFDPLVGTYTWTGRVDHHPELADLVSRGGREVTLRTPGGHEAAGSLGEVNPWGGYRVSGSGRPPYPVERADVADDPLTEGRSSVAS